jgi:hypothetical protein
MCKSIESDVAVVVDNMIVSPMCKETRAVVKALHRLIGAAREAQREKERADKLQNWIASARGEKCDSVTGVVNE